MFKNIGLRGVRDRVSVKNIGLRGVRDGVSV